MVLVPLPLGPCLERRQGVLEAFQGLCRGDIRHGPNSACAHLRRGSRSNKNNTKETVVRLQPGNQADWKGAAGVAAAGAAGRICLHLPAGRSLLADQAGTGHLERKAEARQVLARVIVRVGELPNLEILRPRFLALVDRGVEVDEVPPRLAGRFEEDLHVALAVERSEE